MYAEWLQEFNFEKESFFQNSEFIRIGKNVDGLSMLEECEKRRKVITQKVGSNIYNETVDLYYYVGREAEPCIDTVGYSLAVSRLGFLFKNTKFNHRRKIEEGDFLVLPIYCYCPKSMCPDDDNRCILETEDTFICDQIGWPDIGDKGTFGMSPSNLYKESEYSSKAYHTAFMAIRLPKGYEEMEYIEGALGVDAYSPLTVHFVIKLYDLQLEVLDNLQSFLNDGVKLRDNKMLYGHFGDFYIQEANSWLQNAGIDSFHNVYFESLSIDMTVPNCTVTIKSHTFVKCTINVLWIEEGVDCHFEDDAFTGCTVKMVECESKYKEYFSKNFDGIEIFCY